MIDKDFVPEIVKITRLHGLAGQYSYVVAVRYPHEDLVHIEFVGSIYGGPIILINEHGRQVTIDREVTERLGGKLTPQYVRGFLAPGNTSPWTNEGRS